MEERTKKKRVYIDKGTHPGIISYFMSDYEPVWAGTTIYSMPETENNTVCQKLSAQYDVQFLFDGDIPEMSFYSVPWIEIFAKDSQGGYFAGLGGVPDLDEAGIILYIDIDRKVFKLADNLRQFVEEPDECKKHRTDFRDVAIFESREKAYEKFEFIDPEDIFEI